MLARFVRPFFWRLTTLTIYRVSPEIEQPYRAGNGPERCSTAQNDTHRTAQGTVGQQGPQSQFIATLPSDYKTALITKKKTYVEKQPSKETKYDTAGYENPKQLCGEKGTHNPAC